MTHTTPMKTIAFVAAFFVSASAQSLEVGSRRADRIAHRHHSTLDVSRVSRGMCIHQTKQNPAEMHLSWE